MVYSFYTEIKVRGSGIRRNTMIRKNKLRLTLTTALMTAALGFPALASERIEDITGSMRENTETAIMWM